jgi:hypothetical protein
MSLRRDEIQRIKAGNPDITHREAFSAAAKNVNFLLLGRTAVTHGELRVCVSLDLTGRFTKSQHRHSDSLCPVMASCELARCMPSVFCGWLSVFELLAPPARGQCMLLGCSARFGFPSSCFTNQNLSCFGLLSFAFAVGPFPAHPFWPHAGSGTQEDLQDPGH